MSNSSKIRLCNVHYLNSTPYRSVKKLSWIDYQECEPAEGARKLHERECELALIPLAEAAASGDYYLLNYGIAACGPVDSVFLLANCPLEDVKRVFLDSASRSSALLLKLLLHDLRQESGGRKPDFSIMPVEEALENMDDESALLVIGDKALRRRDEFSLVIDLSELWYERTRLPFLFAAWAVRGGVLNKEQLEELEAVFKEGVEKREVYARQWAEDHGFSREEASKYVLDRIVYPLDEKVREGAREFFRKGAEVGLLPYCSVSAWEEKLEAPSWLKQARGIRSLDSVLADASSGHRLSLTEAKRLAQEASLADLALASDAFRQELHPHGRVSYIIDRNINYTNICNVYCRFCAFYRAPGKDGGYVLTKQEIANKIQETVDNGGAQILLQGGLNPELEIDYYEDLFTWITENFEVKLHALSSDEVWHISKVSNLSLYETLRRLIAAGMNSLPGGGGEILVDRIRRRIAKLKTSSAEWLEVHRTAHRLGITSTATMMFGVEETWEDRISHFYKIRSLQDETGGITAFVSWPFQSGGTKLRAGVTSSVEYLRVQALSRLFLDNIANIQNSWVTQGPSVGQIALSFGANDFGSVMFEESVVSEAGTSYRMDSQAIERHIIESGFQPWRRDVHYKEV